ncbi:hypothetical protein C4573_03105 [Candidatus Woesearchaeota archaeon]|nr:MAG: hypothetical protein C4573_03105 [Candidatus Woesearchaeota archaeon]
MAVQKYHIDYPVVLDNDYQTWRAYQNRYWPRKYLIDIDGFIVYDHIGEGNYGETESKIQELLKERNAVLKENTEISKGLINPNTSQTDFSKIATPEIYFGYGFSRNQMGNKEGWKPEQTVEYAFPLAMQNNLFYLQGAWKNSHDFMESSGEGKIALKYTAKNVNLVAGSEQPANISIYLDGAMKKTITVHEEGLYPIITEPAYGTHTLEIAVPEGLKAYTFTFG